MERCGVRVQLLALFRLLRGVNKIFLVAHGLGSDLDGTTSTASSVWSDMEGIVYYEPYNILHELLGDSDVSSCSWPACGTFI